MELNQDVAKNATNDGAVDTSSAGSAGGANNSENNNSKAQQDVTKTTERTFTQAEVNSIVQERLARVPKQEPKQNTSTSEGNAENNQINRQMQEIMSSLVSSEIKVGLSAAGISPDKVSRAVRLVDVKNCVTESGMPDNSKIQNEIAELVKEFPEFKAVESNSTGFKVGKTSDNSATSNVAQKTALDEAFGLTT